MLSIHQRRIPRLAVTYLMIACGLSALKAQGSSNHNSAIAIVTSSKGETRCVDVSEASTKIALHDTLSLSDQALMTGKNAHLFLVCSNGLALGIHQKTEVSFINYTQAPFTEERAKLEFEPSTSTLDVELISGVISISSDGLSPRSKVLVNTPNGTVRVHSANCLIEQSDIGTTIMTFDGNATFHYAEGDQREFISKLNGIRISAQSAELGKIAETIDMAQIDSKKHAFSNATRNASNRVHFKAPVDGKPATPVLITPRAYFETPSARPYEYTE